MYRGFLEKKFKFLATFNILRSVAHPPITAASLLGLAFLSLAPTCLDKSTCLVARCNLQTCVRRRLKVSSLKIIMNPFKSQNHVWFEAQIKSFYGQVKAIFIFV